MLWYPWELFIISTGLALVGYLIGNKRLVKQQRHNILEGQERIRGSTKNTILNIIAMVLGILLIILNLGLLVLAFGAKIS
jgi:hypothetical protein